MYVHMIWILEILKNVSIIKNVKMFASAKLYGVQ